MQNVDYTCVIFAYIPQIGWRICTCAAHVRSLWLRKKFICEIMRIISHDNTSMILFCLISWFVFICMCIYHVSIKTNCRNEKTVCNFDPLTAMHDHDHRRISSDWSEIHLSSVICTLSPFINLDEIRIFLYVCVLITKKQPSNKVV